MNYVYLDSKYNEFYVGDDAYAQIVAITMANKHCMYDHRTRHPYTTDNPCVGKSICLEHFLVKHRHLTRLEIVGETTAKASIYYFVDEQGYVYTSTEDTTDDARRDVSETLSYYGFTPPGTISGRGKMVSFYSYYASLYGDLRSASVIVLVYNQSSENVKGLFLLYKNAPAVELSKRGEHKTLYTKATELVEASKDSRGEYHINGNSHYSFYTADVYEVISQLESAMYDVTRKLKNGSVVKTTGEPDEEPMREDSNAG